jgi:prephenate dehydrogenase
MAIRQITIIGTGLIGGSLGLALKANGFRGRVVGSDRAPVLERAKECAAIDKAVLNPMDAVRGSQVVVLAAPVGAIISLIDLLGPLLPAKTLLTDVGSTKVDVVAHAQKVFGASCSTRFLAGHPMAGKESSGVENADPELFRGAMWLITPTPGQDLEHGVIGEFVGWIEKIGAQIAELDARKHDYLCAWVSHLPQMIATALAASLVEEFGSEAPLLSAGGRALREMTRISASPYSMWRDIALTNKKNIQATLLKLEQRLAHIRENLDTRQLAQEFDRAHHLNKTSR